MSARELIRAVDLMVNQVTHWTPARWTVRPQPGGPSRAELLHSLVQRLADLALEAEGLPRREVPRLDNDLSLVDQLRVVAADLIKAGADDQLTHAAATDVSATRARL